MVKHTGGDQGDASDCVANIRDDSGIFALPNDQLSCNGNKDLVVTGLTVSAASFDCATDDYIIIEYNNEKMCGKVQATIRL